MRSISLLLATLLVIGLLVVWPTHAAKLDGTAKRALERTLVGQWAVPKSKYKVKISFDFKANRTFTCEYTAKKKEPVVWKGAWRVRTAGTGDAKAYLKARDDANPKSVMKAILIANADMTKFAIDITFNFRSDKPSPWSSRINKSTGGEEEDEDKGDEEDEDKEDEEDEEDEEKEDEDKEGEEEDEEEAEEEDEEEDEEEADEEKED